MHATQRDTLSRRGVRRLDGLKSGHDRGIPAVNPFQTSNRRDVFSQVMGNALKPLPYF